MLFVEAAEGGSVTVRDPSYRPGVHVRDDNLLGCGTVVSDIGADPCTWEHFEAPHGLKSDLIGLEGVPRAPYRFVHDGIGQWVPRLTLDRGRQEHRGSLLMTPNGKGRDDPNTTLG